MEGQLPRSERRGHPHGDLAPAGRITVEVVEEEIGRLEAAWHGTDQDDEQGLLEEVLGRDCAAELDRFDRGQLTAVIRLCRQSRTLSEAGRQLFERLAHPQVIVQRCRPVAEIPQSLWARLGGFHDFCDQASIASIVMSLIAAASRSKIGDFLSVLITRWWIGWKMADASENTEPRRFPELDDPEPILLTVVEPAPPKRPHPGFWWAVLWCLGILLVTQILPSFVAGFIFASSNFSNQQSQKAPSAAEVVRSQGFADAMLPGMVFGGVASLALGLLAIRLIVGKEWPRILALRRPSGSHLALALAGLPALMLLAIGIDGVAQRALPAVFDYEGMYAMFGKWSWPMGLAVIGLLPGIAEELWFRGFFGRGLVGRHGVPAGVLLSSFLFGAMHLEPRQAACAMFLGVFLHLSYLASRSLAVPMTLHVLNNSIAISASMLRTLAFLNTPAADVPWYCYAAAALSLAAVARTFYVTRCRLAPAAETDALAWRPAFPGVESPPQGSASRLLRPAAGIATWAFVAVSTTPLVVALAIGIRPPEPVQAVPSEVRATTAPALPRPPLPALQARPNEALVMLRREPISAQTWPAWSQRLRSWLGDTGRDSDAAFGAARAFLRQQYASGEFPPPMRDDAIAWYVYGRAQIRSLDDADGTSYRAQLAERLLRRSMSSTQA